MCSVCDSKRWPCVACAKIRAGTNITTQICFWCARNKEFRLAEKANEEDLSSERMSTD